MPEFCEACSRPARFRCGACGAYYCGRECQLAHWPTHQLTCGHPKVELVGASDTRHVSAVDVLADMCLVSDGCELDEPLARNIPVCLAGPRDESTGPLATRAARQVFFFYSFDAQITRTLSQRTDRSFFSKNFHRIIGRTKTFPPVVGFVYFANNTFVYLLDRDIRATAEDWSRPENVPPFSSVVFDSQARDYFAACFTLLWYYLRWHSKDEIPPFDLFVAGAQLESGGALFDALRTEDFDAARKLLNMVRKDPFPLSSTVSSESKTSLDGRVSYVDDRKINKNCLYHIEI